MAQNITPESLISTLAAALAQQPTKPLVLALDGRCGSGKTTLANTLARQFPASITLHTDDFYLPPTQRIRGWEKTPCANMDLARLRDEALRPAYEGQPVQYRAYSCREGAYLPARELAAQPLVILEGSYSHHPLLTGYETLRVFLTCAKEEQTRRLQAREGGAICKLCRPVGAAGGSIFCAVPHCGDGGFCGRHHAQLSHPYKKHLSQKISMTGAFLRSLCFTICYLFLYIS